MNARNYLMGHVENGRSSYEYDEQARGGSFKVEECVGSARANHTEI